MLMVVFRFTSPTNCSLKGPQRRHAHPPMKTRSSSPQKGGKVTSYPGSSPHQKPPYRRLT